MKTSSAMAAVLALFTAAQLSAMSNSLAPTDPVPETELAVSGLTPFCKAIMNGDAATVEKMIQLGEDVNRKSLGKTPVIFAARYNQPEILKMLLANGADPTIRCDKGHSAMKYAELSNATEAMQVLRQAKKA
ncbi:MULTISPECIES: ankyrin repeat domain-containing protein [Robiginitalea]|uniref:ankyrin repeat domain-containing protein n=1 Tax=Robiginitalea TaxID=252306 RepID=UPI00234A415C|nr:MULTISPECIES: ankyrin repeat domain-containing protein [unclassified Robiginitalea]MDC6354638.1 ankyrin repeat domain-containing protein [Robiginitalea sp. PM2]MDC6374680.1 ankyrin repeat domain-containing protein [Robiginitalea sp. SP8]